MDCLPPELLTQIFSAAVELDPEGWYGHPPIILSHVSQMWRGLVLSTPYLWSHISLRGFGAPDIINAFLSRSRDVSIEVDYADLPLSMAAEECIHVRDFLNNLSPHLHRCKAFSFRCKSAAAVTLLLPFLDKFTDSLPKLQRLSLTISSQNPSFLEAPDLLLPLSIDAERDKEPPNLPCLRYLVLNQVPPRSLPTQFICNLRKLELSYSLGKQHTSWHYYYLKLTSLCGLLSLTPRLEELTMINTVPIVDALPAPTPVLDNASSNSPTMYLRPVRLEHLKSIEWTYPSNVDVPRLLLLLDAPVLDKLDLWVEKPSSRRSHPTHRPSATPDHIQFPALPMLRDLSLQCSGDEEMFSVLRRFSLPAIERVAFTNIDAAARKKEEGKEPQLIVFPRLESIFHDPRLPQLTHLTLSHVKIPFEAAHGESLLGYMPVLTSLSLDSCIGAGRLLEGLQEKLLIGSRGNAAADHHKSGRPSKRGVKLCPRLEALSIWGCQDVVFGSLRAVVLARNGSPKDKDIPTQGDGTEIATKQCPPRGTVQENVMGYDFQARSSREGSQVGHPNREVMIERKVKPLRSKHPLLSPSQFDPKAKIVSTLVAMREVMEPANIIYIRAAQCKLVTKEQAFSLRDLGVIDVIWD